MSRIKILHIISGDLWAGAEVQVFTLIKQLRQCSDVKTIILNDGELATRIRKIGVSVIILDESQFSTLQIFLKIRKILMCFNPDIVHTHRQKENILGALANVTTIRARSVRTVHGKNEFSFNFRAKMQGIVERLVTTCFCNVIIAVSEDLRKKLHSEFPTKIVKVIYNGVDVEELKKNTGIAQFKKDKPDKKHIGMIGRLVAVKRVDIFLKISEIIKREIEGEYFFHIVGDGPLRSELEILASKLGVTDVVQFHGHRSDIPSIINSLDVVVMCSDYEGLPMTALETIALDSILLAHKIGGLAELACYNNVFLTDINRERNYTKKLVEISGSRIKTVNFSHTANKNMSEIFSIYSAMLD